MTWANIIRAMSILTLLVLFVSDYGFAALAKDLPKEVYFGLIAVALGVDIKGLRDIILRALGVGKGGDK